MGANRWRDAPDWPIPGTRFTKYYLRSLGEANTRYGNGRLDTDAPGAEEPPDHYRYDPANPVPSRGGHSCCTPDVAPVGPFDQADIEERADVLVYSTPALQQLIEITGPISVTLFAASSAVDTDWTASGRARYQPEQWHYPRTLPRLARAHLADHPRPDLQVCH